jgi:hypothetical protein
MSNYQNALRKTLQEHPGAYAIYSDPEDPLRPTALDQDEVGRLMREDGAPHEPAKLDEDLGNDWKYDGQARKFRILRRAYADRLAKS